MLQLYINSARTETNARRLLISYSECKGLLQKLEIAANNPEKSKMSIFRRLNFAHDLEQLATCRKQRSKLLLISYGSIPQDSLKLC